MIIIIRPSGVSVFSHFPAIKLINYIILLIEQISDLRSISLMLNQAGNQRRNSSPLSGAQQCHGRQRRFRTNIEWYCGMKYTQPARHQ